MSSTIHRLGASARTRLRNRRDEQTYRRAYQQASPSMQAELLVLSQHQRGS